MGHGLGPLQLAIIKIFTEDPRAVRSTSELCRAAYDKAPEKRHRVAVLRALRSLDGHRLWIEGRIFRFEVGRVCERGDDLWYNHAIHRPSYGKALGRVRTRKLQAR